MKIDDIRNDIRQGVGNLLDTVTEGWNRLRETASGAITRFKPAESANLPAGSEVDDGAYMPTHAWAMLGGDVYEDDKRLVVRLEVPGMDKKDFQVEVLGDTLTVRGEKRFERESTEGRWRVLQCAYGHFHRSVPLPVEVRSEEAQASYKDGVLKIVLPKVETAKPRAVNIKLA
jgi:HSP20 family protein